MIFYRCSGLAPSETVLWENSLPASTFSAQTATLNESMDNYDYLKLEYKAGNSNENSLEVVWPVSSVKKMTNANLLWGAFAGVNSSGKYGRYITYVDDTQLSISTSYAFGGSGSSSGPCIPLRIIGIKRSPKVTEFINFGRGYFPIAAGSSTKVTLGNRPKTLTIKFQKSETASTLTTYSEYYSTTKQIRSARNGSSQAFSYYAIPYTSTASGIIQSIDDDGFTLAPVNSTFVSTYCADSQGYYEYTY